MKTLTDNQLNKLLANQGTAMPTLEGFSKKVKPRISSSIYNGKGIEKGATYKGSPYLAIQEELKSLSKGFLDEPILEFKEGLLPEAVALVDKMKSEFGIVVNLPEFVDARKAVSTGKAPSNPVELLLKYRKELHEASEPIDEMKNTLLAHIEEDQGMKFLDTNRLSLEWCMAKAHLSQEERNYGAHLLATKDVLVAKYEAEAERYLNDSHPLANALLYARLYIASVKDAQNRKEADMKKRWDRVRRGFVSEYGRAPRIDEEKFMKDIIFEEVSNKSESGFPSIQSLYSLGALQFIQWADKGEITTKSRTLRSITGYFSAGRLLTDDEVEAWTKLPGQMVEIVDGQLNGLALDDEDKLLMKETYVTPKMEELYYYEDEALKQRIHETKYLKGAKAWIGGHQQAVVVHTKVFKMGVRVFLMGVKNI